MLQTYMDKSDDRIDSVAQWVQQACRFARDQIKGPRQHQRTWFRGQSEHRWPLRPKVFRKLSPSPDANELKNVWRKEVEINREFQSWSSNLSSLRDPTDCYFLQQHYGVPTRFLDWTRNALVALYFATERGAENEDGKIFIMDAETFPEQSVPWLDKKRHIQGFATKGHPIFDPIMAQLYYYQDGSFPAAVFPVFPHFLDTRMQIQRATFTYHSPEHPILTLDRNQTLTEFLVNAKEKESIRSDLARLGIDEFFIFGDLSSLAKTIQLNHSF